MDKFITTWDGRGVQDDGAYTSKEFKGFSLQFKNFLKRILPNGAAVTGWTTGHYFLSGFIRKNDNCYYISYSIPRGESPLDFGTDGPFSGVLFRTAENEKDYHGGQNTFCSVKGLKKHLGNMVK